MRAESKTGRRQTVCTLLLLLTALIWGVAFVAQSVGAEKVGPFTFLASRNYLAFAVLIPVTLFQSRAMSRSEGMTRWKQALPGGILCGVFLCAASAAQQIGIAYTTAAKSSFITSLYVVVVPILSTFAGKKPSARIWISVVLGIIGLYFLCMKESFVPSFGDLITMVCTLLFGLHILAVGKYGRETDGVILSMIQFLTGAVISTILALVLEKPSPSQLSSAMIPILYAGILSSGVGYTLQIIAQKGINPTLASLTMSLESVFGALSGWLILNQALSARELLGCGIMFAAVVLAQLPLEQFLYKKEVV